MPPDLRVLKVTQVRLDVLEQLVLPDLKVKLELREQVDLPVTRVQLVSREIPEVTVKMETQVQNFISSYSRQNLNMIILNIKCSF